MVVRFYTQARKIPFFLGKFGDWRIWGGPYTLTQVVVFVAVAWIGQFTMPLWAGGWLPIFAWVPVLIVAGASGFAVGKIPLKGRNPLLLLLGILSYADAPTWGTCGGKDVTLKKNRTIRHRSSIPTRLVPSGPSREQDDLRGDALETRGGEPLGEGAIDELTTTEVQEGSSLAGVPAPVATAPVGRPERHQLNEVQLILAASAQRK